MQPDSRTPQREPSILTDADFAAIGAALDAFQHAAGEAATAGPCGRSPACIVAAYFRDSPPLRAGVLTLLDTPAAREDAAGLAALLAALIFALADGQRLSPFGRRLLVASILRLDFAAIVAELAEGGDGEAA